MALVSYSGAFVEWVGSRLVAASDGMLERGCTLFFHSDQDVGQCILKALSSKLGYCCEVSHASFEPEEAEGVNNRFASMEVEVTIARSLLSKADTAALAENVYAAMVGVNTRQTRLPRVGDVWVGRLAASVDAQNGCIMHTFTISTKIDLTPKN